MNDRRANGLQTFCLRDELLVNILRVYLADLARSAQTHTTSWLCALKDVQIGKALTRMHADVAKKWKVEHLASEVGMSRTTFSERFKALVGVPPLEYLIHWRMMIARDALKNGRDTLSDIAMRVGYASETSFSAAFKNAFGQSPGRIRSLIRSENAHQLRETDGTLETF